MNHEVPLGVTISLPFLGYAVAVATEFLRGWLSLKKDREARHDALNAAREDERRAFERETLIELQDAMASLMRNTALVIHCSEIEYGQNGTWGRRQLPDEIGGEVSSDLARNFNRLRVRVLNDGLRHQTKEWWEAGAQATIGGLRDEKDDITRQGAMANWERCRKLYEEVFEKIGEQLRVLVAHWDD